MKNIGIELFKIFQCDDDGLLVEFAFENNIHQKIIGGFSKEDVLNFTNKK